MLIPAFMILVALGALVGSRPVAAQEPSRLLVVATTTSLQETGLLDSLAPLFQERTGMRLRVVAVGSGQALRMGERGDADVVLVHSPAAEEAFMRAGFGVRRQVIASNFFTIAGAPDDPANVKTAPSAAEALRRIAGSNAVFVSRGDSSGTHAREMALWRQAGERPGWPGYLESGQGQTATLLVAAERRGYALTDRATLASLRDRIALVPLREPEPGLLNVYHVIELNPAGRPRLNVAGARAFADFLTSEPIQDLLADFGRARFGEPLFLPARGIEPRGP
jgi:tungstate transport system substrate-binding protein